jgi:hypothetical protein
VRSFHPPAPRWDQLDLPISPAPTESFDRTPTHSRGHSDRHASLVPGPSPNASNAQRSVPPGRTPFACWSSSSSCRSCPATSRVAIPRTAKTDHFLFRRIVTSSGRSRVPGRWPVLSTGP